MNQKKIKKLVAHLRSGGAVDLETLADILGVTIRSVKTIEKYLEAAGEEDVNLVGLAIGDECPYEAEEEEEQESEEEPEEEESEEEEEEPEEEEEEEDPEPASDPEPEPPAKPTPPKKKKQYRFFYEKADGTSVELERISSKSKGSIVTFQEKSITDMVSVMLAGEVVEVDIVALRKKDANEESEFGVSNDKLLVLALAAKP